MNTLPRTWSHLLIKSLRMNLTGCSSMGQHCFCSAAVVKPKLSDELSSSSSSTHSASSIPGTSSKALENSTRDQRPDLNFDYLLNPANRESIRQNISVRKQVGDIDELHSIWNEIQNFTEDKKDGAEWVRQLKELWDKFYASANRIPNDTSPQTPIGGEENAKIVQVHGEVKELPFKPKEGEYFGVFAGALKNDISVLGGSKSYAFMGPFSRLEKALTDFTLSYLKNTGHFEYLDVPDIIPTWIPEACGVMQRSAKDILYRLKDSPNYCLSGTGEMGLASKLAGRCFTEKELLENGGKMFMTLSRCYRPEIASGAVEHGIYRVHEFNKVEMFGLTVNNLEASQALLHRFLEIEMELFKQLNLHFKVLSMPSHELGAPAYEKYDIEAWFPARRAYGEISSTSNCTDFQSRRLNITYVDSKGNRQFTHSLNGTACATTRLVLAVIEGAQRKADSKARRKVFLEIPKAVEQYLPKIRMNRPLKSDNVQTNLFYE